MRVTPTRGDVVLYLAQYRADVANAKTLLRAWRRRFREQYFVMDQHRCAALVKTGRLRDIEFNGETACELGEWYTRVGELEPGLEGDLQFDPGQ